MICIYIFYPILFLVFVCEREQYSIRQRRGVPHNGLLRLLYFLHATGVYNAIAWFFLFLAINVGLFFFWYVLSSTHHGSYNEWNFVVKGMFWRLLPFAMMVFCWAVTAFFLWKVQLYRILPREWLSFPLFCFAIIVLIFYYALMIALSWNSADSAKMLSILFSPFPIIVGVEEGTMAQYFLGVIGSLVLVILSSERIFNSFEQLSPYDAPKVLSEEELREAIGQAGCENPGEAMPQVIEPEIIEVEIAQG